MIDHVQRGQVDFELLNDFLWRGIAINRADQTRVSFDECLNFSIRIKTAAGFLYRPGRACGQQRDSQKKTTEFPRHASSSMELGDLPCAMQPYSKNPRSGIYICPIVNLFVYVLGIGSPKNELLMLQNRIRAG